MGRFLRHGPCSNCGSRDNVAIYSDGSSYCFGCGDTGKSKIAKWFIAEEETKRVLLPEDVTLLTSGVGFDWVTQYELTPKDIVKNNILWSESRQQVIYPWYDSTGVLLAYQARNFIRDEKHRKYFSQGNLNDLLPIYQSVPSSDTLVLVEDVISAIKISHFKDSMPCLSSQVPTLKLNRLAGLYKAFLIWLDHDMYKNAMKMQEKLELLGCKASVILTEKDPKELPYDEIKCLTNS